MTKKIGVAVALLAFSSASAIAQNPVTPFTDVDGVPKREYLQIAVCYGGLTCRGTCDILNTQDGSKMSCDAWFARYCPKSLNSEHCRKFDEEVGTAIVAD
ncbi:MAG: hypothetical protein JOY64_23680 [Alphaproteobacteria bacterium]|nr:hypothetical protein [Alphaproteobacteria bacterium]MBV8410648.1 hypothetical protein [Alphaproteobacteria bacterium]